MLSIELFFNYFFYFIAYFCNFLFCYCYLAKPHCKIWFCVQIVFLNKCKLRSILLIYTLYVLCVILKPIDYLFTQHFFFKSFVWWNRSQTYLEDTSFQNRFQHHACPYHILPGLRKNYNILNVLVGVARCLP